MTVKSELRCNGVECDDMNIYFMALNSKFLGIDLCRQKYNIEYKIVAESDT